METKTVNVYSFNELSASAKARAKHDHDAAFGYVDAEDALASLKAFAEHFGSELVDYSVDWGNSSYSSAKFADVDLDAEELAYRVAQLNHDGSCQFTGYCADDDCNEGAVKAYNAGERDVQKLLEAGFQSWLKASQYDYEALMEDAAFGETCDANEWQFYSDGRIFRA